MSAWDARRGCFWNPEPMGSNLWPLCLEALKTNAPKDFGRNGHRICWSVTMASLPSKSPQSSC